MGFDIVDALDKANELFWEIADNKDMSNEDQRHLLREMNKLCDMLSQLAHLRPSASEEKEIDEFIKEMDEKIGLY